MRLLPPAEGRAPCGLHLVLGVCEVGTREPSMCLCEAENFGRVLHTEVKGDDASDLEAVTLGLTAKGRRRAGLPGPPVAIPFEEGR